MRLAVLKNGSRVRKNPCAHVAFERFSWSVVPQMLVACAILRKTTPTHFTLERLFSSVAAEVALEIFASTEPLAADWQGTLVRPNPSVDLTVDTQMARLFETLAAH